MHAADTRALLAYNRWANDRMLDDAVERSYRDLSIRRLGGLSTTSVQRELREIRVDLARLQDLTDQESWKDFFDTYWRLIYSVAIKSGLSDAEAQDGFCGPK